MWFMGRFMGPACQNKLADNCFSLPQKLVRQHRQRYCQHGSCYFPWKHSKCKNSYSWFGILQLLSVSHKAAGSADRRGPMKPLTLFIFPAQFSVKVFDDSWQFLLLPLTRCFIRDREVKKLRVAFRFSCLDIVPEVHSTTDATFASSFPEPSCKQTGEPVHRTTTRNLIGSPLHTCCRTDNPLSNHDSQMPTLWLRTCRGAFGDTL